MSGLPELSCTRGQEWNSQTDHIRRRFLLRDGVKKFGTSTRRNRIANGVYKFCEPRGIGFKGGLVESDPSSPIYSATIFRDVLRYI